VAKVPIHFIGFVANVDDSITRLRLHDGFMIQEKRKPYNEVSPFFDRIKFQYGLTGALPLAFDAWTGYSYITKPSITEFEGVPGVRAIPQAFALMSGLADSPRNQLRLLRLFKEGNPIMRYAFLYYEKDQGVEITNVAEERPIADNTQFALADAEIPEAQVFIDEHRLPFTDSFIQLAFESFDLSYEIPEPGLAFLSLMIAMEALFSPKDNYSEITHRISRNTAVLLGKDQEDGAKVFEDMKDLYKKRSKIVHQGKRAAVTRQDVLKLRQYVRETIKEAIKSGMSKDALLDTLNSCGFGRRPWRAEQ